MPTPPLHRFRPRLLDALKGYRRQQSAGSLPGTFSGETTEQLLIATVTIALLGAIESLLCARIADNLLVGARHNPSQELMAQGVANFIVPFFGGIPATGTNARTVTNVRAGGTSPVAGIVHALTVLAVAVEVGLLLACVFFIYRMSTLFKVLPPTLPDGTVVPAGVQVLEVYGSLFFGAVGKIEALPALLQPGTRALLLDMHRLVLIDTSGLDAWQQLWRQLQRQNVGLVLARVNEQPPSLMRRSGFEAVIGSERIASSLDAALVGAAAHAQATQNRA